MENWNWGETNNNGVGYRDVYPSSPGASIAQKATGGTSAAPAGSVMPGGNDMVSKAVEIGSRGNAIVGMGVFLVLTFGLMYLAKWLGNGDDFKSLKPSVYNVATISLAAIVGIPAWKFLFNKVPVPGVTTWVNAA